MAEPGTPKPRRVLVRLGILVSLAVLLADSAVDHDAVPDPWRMILNGTLFAATGFFVGWTVVRVLAAWPERRWRCLRRGEPALVLVALLAQLGLLLKVFEVTEFHVSWARGFVFANLVMVLVRALGKRLSASRNPAKEFVTTFVGVILAGTVLLSFPRSGGAVVRHDWLDALFTATSATCVTGLSTVPDVGRDFSRFGHGIILALMQVGGLGLMTFAAFVALAMGRGLAIRERANLRGALNLEGAAVTRTVGWILLLTVVVEGLACGALWVMFHEPGLGRASEAPFFSALFHSVSAFCNAGFALDPSSLASFSERAPLVVLVVMVEIVIGGLGFLVVFDVVRRMTASIRRRRASDEDEASPRPRLGLQSKIVLLVTAVLLVVGTGFFLIAEWSNPQTLGPMSTSQKLLAGTFQSVTTRTAGFSTIDQAHLTPASKLFSIAWMLIGASPGSTGGGLKTVTVFVVLALLWSTFHHRSRTHTFGRSLPREVTDRALVVMTVFLGVILAATLVLVIFDWSTPMKRGLASPFLPLLFEVASALGTTGLSTGITPELSVPSKLCLIVVMFVGRMGPLTLVLAMRSRHARKTEFDYPEERVMIG